LLGLLEVHTVNGFTFEGKGGNPAGIVRLKETLDEQTMQKIAYDLGYSETAFIKSHQANNHSFRFFTPLQEVGICGHATVAGFSYLYQQKIISPGEHNMNCGAGQLPITVMENGLISMRQKLPEFGKTLPVITVAPLLNLETEALPGPIQIVSTGLRKIFCPVESRDKLDSISPDEKAIINLSKEHNVTGIYCFSYAAGKIICRNFAPLVGISEDNATGTSAAALGCYLWHRRERTEKEFPLHIVQGGPHQEKGTLFPNLTIEKDNITSVSVAGWGETVNTEIIEVAHG